MQRRRRTAAVLTALALTLGAPALAGCDGDPGTGSPRDLDNDEPGVNDRTNIGPNEMEEDDAG